MLKVTCIEKLRDKNNHIIGYRIIGNNKKAIPVKSESLKEAIRSGQLEVTNLTLTSDNRLIDKRPDTHSKSTTTPSKPNINVEATFNKAKILGYNMKEFTTACGHKCYIASTKDNLKHIFIIPDDVKYIYKLPDHITYDYNYNEVYSCMLHIEGVLRVVGGKNLISAWCMFEGCKAQSIDLRSFDTSKITNMQRMFSYCVAQSLDLSSFDTRNVADMSNMFYNCEAQFLDLSSFNTSNVTNMGWMFFRCKAQSLDLSSFNTSNVTDMNNMFCECKAHSIDLSSFDTSNVVDMHDMLQGCEAQFLDLRSFNTNSISDATGTKHMFFGCKAQVKVNDHKLKYRLQYDRR